MTWEVLEGRKNQRNLHMKSKTTEGDANLDSCPHAYTHRQAFSHKPHTIDTLRFFQHSRYTSPFINEDAYLQSGDHTENTVIRIKHYG